MHKSEGSVGIELNVKWKFKVNGKEYGSAEEMPGPVREAYEKAVDISPGPGHGDTLASTRIVFNGREYANVDAMPAEIRQMNRSIVKAVETGDPPPGENAGGMIGSAAVRPRVDGFPVSSGLPGPITPESSSTRKLIGAAAALTSLATLYLLIHR